MRRHALNLFLIAIVALAILAVLLAADRGLLSGWLGTAPVAAGGMPAPSLDVASPPWGRAPEESFRVPREPARRSTVPPRMQVPRAGVVWRARTLRYRLLAPGPREMTFGLLREGGRIALRFPAQAQEWHFQRNPLSDAEFSGMLVNHRFRRILSFEWAELRQTGFARDWRSVGLLGFDPAVLREMHETHERRTAFGLTFHCWRTQEGDVSRSALPREVWWNDDESLPLRIVWPAREGDSVQELVACEAGVADEDLRPPTLRHPTYFAMDVVDARESQDCGNGVCMPTSIRELMARIATSPPVGAFGARRGGPPR